MDWSRAKTIFIITFLLLNIFLGYQLNEKKTASNLNFVAEATLQERLSEMNITIAAELHEEQLTGTYISGSSELPLDTLITSKLANQEVIKVTDEVVTVSLEKPFQLFQGDISVQVQVKEFVSEHIINGQEYRYSHYNEEMKQVYFFQTYEGKKVDNYESGRFPLMLQLNEDLQITTYEQNYLTIQPIHPQGKEQEVISSIKAIEKLFNEQLVPPDSNITKVELSYFSFFKPHGEVQVFAPMWNIGVNEQIYYVNAIDGAIQNIQ
ncbi:two-component system regulatory protein YycI [Anaerobacillus sp. CMMVII]|uniref:two-component system regulatory protein YycI n=1 Tax=Anaerobacillus sp. CMMVII TaxID=2755588 RepID=UPI0021B761FF|nr:two-component system regulatory protein YycI [Anaerobacillus sp. CMMVII]MCT8139998.1 two-component system regulatory protein YycI [Anaerobacillus sp. CMMVII]